MNEFITTPVGRVPVLVFVAAKGYREIVELFLKHGASLNPKKADLLPLQFAVGASDVGMVKYLLASGADINRPEDLGGYTALIMAASKSSVEMVRLLIQSGADVNARNKSGMTALLIASRRGELAIVEELLLSGANIELGYEDPSGKRNAIEMARQCGHPKVEKLLERWRDRKAVRRPSNKL